MFLDHVRAHSPDKHETIRRYDQVLGHFEMEDGADKPSRWNTLRALRVLDWYSTRD
jgi:hypothetical protein